MIKKILYSIKHYFDYKLICHKKVKIPKNSYIKKPYAITGGNYISIGENVSIQAYSNLACFDMYCDKNYQPQIIIGNNVFINRFFTALSADSLTIGDNTYFGSYVSITNENHGTIPGTICYGNLPLETKSVSIGRNCWIGDHTTILPGASIGEYCIIGAGSVVTKPIPAFCIAVGNPAKIIKTWNIDTKTWDRVYQ